jgi:hypothetical protein
MNEIGLLSCLCHARSLLGKEGHRSWLCRHSNPKFEALNPKQFQSTKFKTRTKSQTPNLKQEPIAKDQHLCLRLEHYDFEFV